MGKDKYDAGNPAHVKNAKRDRMIAENKFSNGMIKICNDPETRHVMAAFLEEARVFQSCFTDIPTQHGYNEGFRNGGLWWLNKALLHDPDIIGKLQRDDDSPVASSQEEPSNTERQENE